MEGGPGSLGPHHCRGLVDQAPREVFGAVLRPTKWYGDEGLGIACFQAHG